jgi:GT2 family glycosyltransferase
MEPELDIVIPVYNEGRYIVATLSLLARSLKTPARVLICYDHAEDDTLPAVRDNRRPMRALRWISCAAAAAAPGAVMTGLRPARRRSS